jgi:hypothetical protein
MNSLALYCQPTGTIITPQNGFVQMGTLYPRGFNPGSRQFNAILEKTKSS